jgi:3-oxoacyl-[acyl-carrier-protein] synthase-3
MVDTGNTVSATIPIALKQCLDTGLLQKGQRVLLIGFGVGYSFGGCVVRV